MQEERYSCWSNVLTRWEGTGSRAQGEWPAWNKSWEGQSSHEEGTENGTMLLAMGACGTSLIDLIFSLKWEARLSGWKQETKCWWSEGKREDVKLSYGGMEEKWDSGNMLGLWGSIKGSLKCAGGGAGRECKLMSVRMTLCMSPQPNSAARVQAEQANNF